MGPGLFQIQNPMDHIGFFVADKALGLTFIHEFMDFFRQVAAVIQVGFFPYQRFDESKKSLPRIIFQEYYFSPVLIFLANRPRNEENILKILFLYSFNVKVFAYVWI